MLSTQNGSPHRIWVEGFPDDGRRIAGALGKKILHPAQHGLVILGRSLEESVGWFVMAERLAKFT